MSYVSLSDLSAALSSTLDLLTKYQSSYDESINLLLTRLHSIQPLHFTDIYDVNKTIKELELISSDLNRRYGKYVKQLSKQMDLIRLNKIGILNTKKIVDGVIRLRQNMGKGILDRNFKLILESYNKIVNVAVSSISNHNNIGKKHPIHIQKSTAEEKAEGIKLLSNDEMERLNLTILTLRRSIETLTVETQRISENIPQRILPSSYSAPVEDDEDEIFSRQPSTSAKKQAVLDSAPLADNFQNVEDMQLITSDTEEEDVTMEEEKIPIPDLHEMAERYNAIQEQLTAILTKLNENPQTVTPAVPVNLTSNVSQILQKVNKTLKLIQNNSTDLNKLISALNAPKLLQQVQNLESKIDVLGSQFTAVDQEKLSYFKNAFKQEINALIQSTITEHFEKIKNMDLSNNPTIVDLKTEIISNVSHLISNQLVNEENILNIIRVPLQKIEQEGMANLSMLIDIMNKEFQSYIMNLTKNDTEIMERHEIALQTNESKLEELANFILEQKKEQEIHKVALIDLKEAIKAELMKKFKIQTQTFNKDIKKVLTNVDDQLRGKIEVQTTEFITAINNKIVEIENRSQQLMNAIQQFTIHQESKLDESKNIQKEMFENMMIEFNKYKIDMNNIYSQLQSELRNITTPFKEDLSRQSEMLQRHNFQFENILKKLTVKQDIEEGIDETIQHFEKLYDGFRSQQSTTAKEFYEKYDNMFQNFIMNFKSLFDKISKQQEEIEKLKVEIVEERADINVKFDKTLKIEDRIKKEIKNTFIKLKNIIDAYLKNPQTGDVEIHNIPTLLQPLTDIQKTYDLSFQTYNLINEQKESLDTIKIRLLEALSKRDSENELPELIKSELINIKAMIDERLQRSETGATGMKFLKSKRRKLEE